MPNASGTTTFTVSSTVEWSVDDDAAWLTATKTDESTISVSYEANASTSSRTANIKAVGTGEVEETVTVTQAAATFDVSPNSRSVTDVSGTTTFTVSSTVGWSVDDDAAWLTATKTDGSTISVSYEPNSGTGSRTANIKAVGTGEVEETITVTQAAATAAVFDVSPNSRFVTIGSGTTTFTVSALVGWTVSDDAAWLTATKTDESTITASYEWNLTESSRTANIRAIAVGGSVGSSVGKATERIHVIEETVTVTQAPAGFTVLPNNRNVTDASGTTTFTVSSQAGWSVEVPEEDDAAWLTATKTDGSTISVSYEANASPNSRTGSIKAFTGAVEKIVTVTQSGS